MQEVITRQTEAAASSPAVELLGFPVISQYTSSDKTTSGFAASMGRGRGRGRKIIPSSRSHEDKGSSGEEVVPVRKRRGRPQKQRPAEKVDLAQVKNLVEGVDGNADSFLPQGGEGDDAKLKENYPEGNGSKRNRVPKEEESSNPDMEENSSSTRSSNDESITRSNGFRHNGSRRKSTPRRAAEAGL